MIILIIIPLSLLTQQGGIYANYLATSEITHLIKGIYAIEMTVTQHGVFMSNEVVQYINQGKDINPWYTDFCQRVDIA
ncbi:hypothetical protein [Shewanella surugensis]|uniref:Uncharacterized protein n=1 Tax=Shewanella surugensis TaxID=212020 RepID=A0ABT0L9X9_9GAMM|nr:hypothetical protein [Shewanella surugensis]MCL1124468.1 hypothetical protein [Shewanella surugensis]